MFKTTVDSILSDFSKTVARLNSLAEKKNAEIEAIKVKEEALYIEGHIATTERDRAKAVAAKLSALLSD